MVLYGNILVPVDGCETSTAGLNEGAQLAKILGSKLRVMHIVNECVLDYTWVPGQFSGNLFEALRQGGKEILDAAEKVSLAQGIRPTRVMVESIGGVAADWQCTELAKLLMRHLLSFRKAIRHSNGRAVGLSKRLST